MSGLLLLLVPLAAISLCGYSLFFTPLIFLSGRLEVVGAVLVLFTASQIAIDATWLRSTLPVADRTGSRPFAWFFAVLMLWVVAYPAYMFKRKKTPGQTTLVGGGVPMLLALVALVEMGASVFAVERARTEIRAEMDRASNAAEQKPEWLQKELGAAESDSTSADTTPEMNVWKTAKDDSIRLLAGSFTRRNSVGDGFNYSSAGHGWKWVVAFLGIANPGSESKTYFLQNIQLVDDQSQRYDVEGSQQAMFTTTGLSVQIPPRTKQSITVLYLLPDGRKIQAVQDKSSGLVVRVEDPPIKTDVAVLKSPDKSMRRAAVTQLLEIGPEALVEVLTAQSKSFSDDPSVQDELRDLVRKLAPRSIPQLVGALGNKDTAGQAAFAIRQVGRKAQAAVPALTTLAQSSDVRLRSLAVSALAKMGPAALPALPVLKSALADSDELTRTSAIEALRGIGPEGRAALSAATSQEGRP